MCLQEVDHITDFYDENLRGLGFNVIYGQRKPSILYPKSDLEHPTTAIAYKTEDWVLIDKELVDLGEVKRWFGPSADDYTSGVNTSAILCLLQNQKSHKTIVLGCAHFEHDPRKDHVKFA